MRPRSATNPAATQRQRPTAVTSALGELAAVRRAAAQTARRQATLQRKARRQAQAERKRANRRARRQLAQRVVHRRQELDRLARTMTQRPGQASRGSIVMAEVIAATAPRRPEATRPETLR